MKRPLKIKYEYVESEDNQQRLDNVFDFIFSKIFENREEKGLYNSTAIKYSKVKVS